MRVGWLVVLAVVALAGRAHAQTGLWVNINDDSSYSVSDFLIFYFLFSLYSSKNMYIYHIFYFLFFILYSLFLLYSTKIIILTSFLSSDCFEVYWNSEVVFSSAPSFVRVNDQVFTALQLVDKIVDKGSDAIGNYVKLSFVYVVDGVQWVSWIKEYQIASIMHARD